MQTSPNRPASPDAQNHSGSPLECPRGGIAVRRLTKSFGEHTALHETNLDIEPGTIVGLIGPNGSGKSTLMRCLIGLCRPDHGQVAVDGVALKGDGVEVRKRLTYAPGEMGVYRETRGGAHLDWFLRGRDRATRKRGRELALELGLPLDRKLGNYSHGMKRQLIFAAAMAPAVPVRILDEITEGLDPSKRTQVTDVLARDATQGTTILLSSHHFGEVDRVCQRILFLQAGRILEDTRAETVRARAARLLRLEWADAREAAAFAAAVPQNLYNLLKHNEAAHQVVIELHDPDPRAAFELVAKHAAPRLVQFGSTTLQDLYRDLYGVEGT